MRQGDALPVLEKEITREGIQLYAAASGDFNPVHLEPAYAESTQFGGIVAHGMLLLAYLSEVMTRAFGVRWVESGYLKTQFRAPARPGHRIVVSGHVAAVTETEEGRRLTCSLEGRNQHGEILITGEARVTQR